MNEKRKTNLKRKNDDRDTRENKRARHDSKKDSSKDHNQKPYRSNTSLRRKIYFKDQEIKNLNHQISQHQEEVKEFKWKQNMMDWEKTSILNENKNLKNQVHKLSEEQKKDKEQIRSQRDTIDDLKSKIEEYEPINHSINNSNENNKNELLEQLEYEDLFQKFKELEKTNSILNQKLDEKRGALELKNNELDILRDHEKKFNEKINTLSQTIETMKEENQSLNQALKQERIQNQTFGEENEKLTHGIQNQIQFLGELVKKDSTFNELGSRFRFFEHSIKNGTTSSSTSNTFGNT